MYQMILGTEIPGITYKESEKLEAKNLCSNKKQPGKFLLL